MTLPKIIEPGQVVDITRRTFNRQFLLANRMDGQTKNDMGFIMCFYAGMYEQQLHSVTIMSNHYHCVMTDSTGLRSDYLRDTHAMMTRLMNRKLGRRDTIWSSQETAEQILLDEVSIEAKILYSAANPVAAGLVEHAEQWDHFTILPSDWGKVMRFERPEFFINPNIPEFIEYIPLPPKSLYMEGETLADVILRYNQNLTSLEIHHQKQRIQKGLTFIGMMTCYNVDYYASPDTIDKPGVFHRFCAATKSAREQANLAFKQFCEQHKKARSAFKIDRYVIFPAGTYQMKRLYDVVCAAFSHDNPLYPFYGLLEI